MSVLCLTHLPVNSCLCFHENIHWYVRYVMGYDQIIEQQSMKLQYASLFIFLTANEHNIDTPESSK